ncbi:phosphotransferase [Curtobacterium sp. DN_7.5]|uniref:phosphotransferase n=2 Tax=unclassified Curtobacterium TaxID=257496 RepID=UPI001F5A232F|nr:phosphotransferase [Curtobacterium sp. DN_7.5]
MGRMTWHEIPSSLRARIEDALGAPVVQTESQASGWSPGSADRVVTTDRRRAFVKALARSRNGDGIDLHRREARVVGAIPPGVRSPGLVAVFDEVHDGDEWVALVLDDVDGHHPGADRDGRDTTAVLDALATLPRATGVLASLPRMTDELGDEFGAWDRMLASGLPSVVPSAVASAAERLADAARGAVALVDGDHLVHADCRADNLLVDRERRVWIVDWPWAGVGARWLDPLTYLLDVLVRGEDDDVDHHLLTHPVFAGVDAAAVDAVLAALAGLFLEKAARPAPPNMPTIRGFQRREGVAATEWVLRRWAQHDGAGAEGDDAPRVGAPRGVPSTP